MPTIPGPPAPPTPAEPPFGAWCTTDDLPCLQGEGAPTLTDQQASDVIAYATQTLYQFTERRWPGVATAVIRPYAQMRTGTPPRWQAPRRPWGLPPSGGSVGYDGAGWWSDGSRGSWGWCDCYRSKRTGSHRLHEVDLLNDVVSVDEVHLNGEVLDPSLYELQAKRFLVGLYYPDGSRVSWPCCQIGDLPDTEPGTFSITEQFGAVVPRPGQLAAGSLACEMAKLFKYIDAPCRLSARATNVVRQGVTASGFDPVKLFADGITGLPEVDLWVAGVLRGSRHRPGKFITPGLHARARRP